MKNRFCFFTSGGFTLLELIIAITIFALCISTVYGLYGSVTSIVTKVEQSSEVESRARMALARLTEDFMGLYTGTQGMLIGSESGGYLGEEPILTMVSSAHLKLKFDESPVDITTIRYYLKTDARAEIFTLMRSDSPVMGGGKPGEVSNGRQHILAKNIHELKISYFHANGEELSSWDSEIELEEGQEVEERFPSSVRIEFVTASEDASLHDKKYSLLLNIPSRTLKFEGGEG